ncbi:DNA-directed RNA polymerase subunit K [Candidatus Woesearchaeota archaeon]|nr:DNA-directed RNA polymerase subunit K [Candidatus Woesearchaeota archaeon]
MSGVIIDKSQYTKYEKTRVIGARALQLSMGAPLVLTLTEEELESLGYDVLKIAEKEFEAGVIPFAVERIMPKKQEVVSQEKAANPA